MTDPSPMSKNELRDYDQAVARVLDAIERAWPLMVKYLGSGWDASDLARLAAVTGALPKHLVMLRQYLQPPE